LGHKRLCALRRALAIDDEAGDGVLMLLREAKQQASLQPRLERLAAAGLAVQAIDAQACLAREPGLNPDAPLHGGLLLGRSSVGNGRLFAQHLRAHAQRLGASFRFHHTVQRVQAKSRGVLVSHVESDASPATRMDGGDAPARPAGPQTESFDAVVLCASLGAAELLCSIWPTLRLATVADATLTLQRRVMEAYPDLGPKAGLLDAKDGVTMARIGQRLRVTGRIGPAHHVRLHATLQHWFPGSVLQSQVQASTRRRLLMPDGLPVLGPSGQPGVWLHLSQGGEAGQGWSAACGAARVLADAISGVTPELDTSALIVPRPT
jgi:D-amino-acid dehydrogenase